MADTQPSQALLRKIRKYQQDEENGCVLYAAMAKREKNPENRQVLQQMSQEERKHALIWKRYTGEDLPPSRWKVLWYRVVTVLLGFTFVIKLMQKNEELTIREYEQVTSELPEAAPLLEEERTHEETLINMLDEERLQYVGSMVLGLNDALVELTGTIAGLTFAMANTRLTALSGIITGVSATLSMAASNYLAERSSGNPKAFKSCLYTGVAYLITVVLLVLPYLLFPEDLYVYALVTMLVLVILIILFFNYYISVAKSLPFARRFGEMALISLSVALLSFVIGILVKEFLGIDVG